MGAEVIIRREHTERRQKFWGYIYNSHESKERSQRIRQSKISPKHKK